MSTALATRGAPVATPSALENLEPVLSMAAEGSTLRTFPPLALIEEARGELVRAIEARPTLAQVRQNIGRLVLSYPQQSRTESPATYIAAMESEAAGYPLDVLAQACRALLRSCKFVPTVCELVETCEGLMEKRRLLLLGAERLKREAERRLAEREADEKREAERVAYRQKIEAAIIERWGDLVPEWFSVARAWKGALDCKASGRYLTEQEAAAGDGAAWVFCRRAALYGLALEMEHATLPGRRRLMPADLMALAVHLCRHEDAAALALIEAPTPPPGQEGAEPPSRLVVGNVMRQALSFLSTVTASKQEGLPTPYPRPEGEIVF